MLTLVIFGLGLPTFVCFTARLPGFGSDYQADVRGPVLVLRVFASQSCDRRGINPFLEHKERNLQVLHRKALSVVSHVCKLCSIRLLAKAAKSRGAQFHL